MVLSKDTKRFLEKSRQQRSQRRIVQQKTQPQRYITPPQQPVNMFQSGQFTTPTESIMDILFGQSGQNEMDKQQAIFPQLQTSDVGDVISSVMAEMNNPQPQRQVAVRFANGSVRKMSPQQYRQLVLQQQIRQQSPQDFGGFATDMLLGDGGVREMDRQQFNPQPYQKRRVIRRR